MHRVSECWKVSAGNNDCWVLVRDQDDLKILHFLFIVLADTCTLLIVLQKVIFPLLKGQPGFIAQLKHGAAACRY